MALLCTLHADGPRTLRLLREAGCTSVEKLKELSPDRVSKVLNLPAAAARRLTREANRLLERLEPDLEQEEVTYPAATDTRGIKPPPAGVMFDGPSNDRMSDRPPLGLRDQELLKRVVERWRSSELPTVEVQPESLGEMLPEPQDTGVEYFVPGPAEHSLDSRETHSIELCSEELHALEPERPVIDSLHPGDIEGLDEETCAALERADVRSLEELATCPADELTMRSGLAFTRARTLQYRAGKQLAQNGSGSLKVLRATEERMSPSDRPVPVKDVRESSPAKAAAVLWDDSGAAGPFA
ncbi:MAG: hypothetical protein ACI9F9_002819 [Candidatus Paceibacteria bacterium]